MLQIFSNLLLDDVGYGPWSPWGECDVPCGLGTRFRQRICRKKRNCAKEGAQQIETCAANLCPIDGGMYGALNGNVFHGYLLHQHLILLMISVIIIESFY